MGLLSTAVRDFNRFYDVVKHKIDPATNISSGASLEDWGVSQLPGRARLEDLEKIYLNFPLVFAGINLFANSFPGRGYFVESTNNLKAKAIVDEIIDSSGFKQMLNSGISQTLRYGNSFQEIIWNEDKTRIMGFVNTDPKTMRTKFDKKGRIVEFVHRNKQGETVHLMPDQICHFAFYFVADNLDGIGFIEPLVKTLEIERDIELSIKDAVKRFACPPLRVIKKGATDAEILALQEEFKGFTRNSFFGTSERYDIEFLNLYKRFPDLSYHMNYILDKICAGLRIPKPILLSSGQTVNRAVLEELIDFNQFEISLIQSKISFIIEEQIFRPICNNNGIYEVPKLRWYPLMTEDERQKAEVRSLEIDAVIRAYSAELITIEMAKERIDWLFEKK